MADAKITALTATTTPISTDVMAIVTDPAGTPVTKKVTVANVLTPQAYSADANGPSITFEKSRNATTGSHTIVQSGDSLGRINFKGSNGTSFDTAGYIDMSVGGTPGASADMPGTLNVYLSADGSATPSQTVSVGRGSGLILYGLVPVYASHDFGGSVVMASAGSAGSGVTAANSKTYTITVPRSAKAFSIELSSGEAGFFEATYSSATVTMRNGGTGLQLTAAPGAAQLGISKSATSHDIIIKTGSAFTGSFGLWTICFLGCFPSACVVS